MSSACKEILPLVASALAIPTAAAQSVPLIPGPTQNARSSAVALHVPDPMAIQSQVIVDTQPQEVYLVDEHPTWVGWGYHFNRISGRWERMSPVGMFTLPAVPEQASVSVRYRNQLSTETYVNSQQATFTIDVAIGLLRAAAGLAQSSYSSEDLLSNSFSFSVVKDFGQQQEPWSIQFSDDAIQFFATHDFEADPGGFRADWIDTFGEYVAIGTKMRAEARLTASLVDQSSAFQTRSFLDLSVEYGSASSSARFVDLMEQRSRFQDIDIGLEAFDLPECPPGDESCPQLSDLIPTDFSVFDTEESRLGYVDTLFDAIVPRATGVVLVPVGNLPGVPEISVSDVDDVLLAQAVEQAQGAI